MAKKKKYNGTNNDLQNIKSAYSIHVLSQILLIILGNVLNSILTLSGGTIFCDI